MKKLLTTLLLTCALATPSLAETLKEPVRIGEMMPYTNGTQYAVPFREGYQIARDEINQSGGIKGRPLEVISRDDQADPTVAVRVAEDLVAHEKVVMLIGAGFDHVGLAIGSFANQNKIPFLKQWSGSCDVLESTANHYWFATTPCFTPYAAVFAREAAKKPYKRWATIAPNYEFGRVMTAVFKKEIKRLRPDVEFVAEQYPAIGQINAAAEIRALSRAKPEAIFSTIFGADLASYLLHAQKVDFLKNIFTISGTNIGSGIAIRAFGDVYPQGWLTEGVPLDVHDHPVTAFIDSFQKKYHRFPDLMAVYGYQMLLLAAQALRDAPSLDQADIRHALENVKINGPFGPVAMKNKQIYSGWWLGYTDNQNGKGRFVNATWYPPEVLFPQAFPTEGAPHDKP